MNKKSKKLEQQIEDLKKLYQSEQHTNEKYITELNKLTNKTAKIVYALLGDKISNINTVLLDDAVELENGVSKRSLRVITNDGAELKLDLLISEIQTTIIYQD